jgi:two-component system, sensor histidine kinase and response regulator
VLTRINNLDITFSDRLLFGLFGMSKPVILCVDDEPLVLASLKVELVRALGGSCIIETAEQASEAIAVFDELLENNQEIALVLADHIMPGIRGDELLRRLHERSPQTLTIMISGQADLETVARSIREARLYRYIPKPWRSEELSLTVIEAIQSYLQTQHLSQQTQNLAELNSHLEGEVRNRTETLESKILELETISQQKEEFLHAISHDLRTPIVGSLLMMRRWSKQTSDPILVERSILDQMLRSNEKQLALIDLLLETHATEVRGVSMNYSEISIAHLIKDVLSNLQPQIQDQSSCIRLEGQEIAPLLWADADQLARVFENLITNALKHNPPGITITIQTHVTLDHFLYCTVKDTGMGLSQEECETLFQAYAQGSRTNRSPGVGLGLYLCQQIILAHEGEIGAKSREIGQGGCIWFKIPMDRRGRGRVS